MMSAVSPLPAGRAVWSVFQDDPPGRQRFPDVISFRKIFFLPRLVPFGDQPCDFRILERWARCGPLRKRNPTSRRKLPLLDAQLEQTQHLSQGPEGFTDLRSMLPGQPCFQQLVDGGPELLKSRQRGRRIEVIVHDFPERVLELV